MSMRLLALLSAVLTVVASACPAPEPPPLKGVQVATITGEVFIEDPDLQSVGGARVSVLGTPASALSQEGKQFVLDSVALGERTVSIVHEELGRATQFKVELSSPFQTLTLDTEDTTLLRSATVTGSVSGFDPAQPLPQVFLVGGTAQQVALVGGDGNFELRNLPARSIKLAVAGVGRGLVELEVELAEDEVRALDPIALAPVDIGNLKLKGTVQLAGETEHEGVTVILNQGDQVASTDAEGAYSFSGLAPGLYEVKAQRPGFRSVVMSTVALSDDGDVAGLFDAFLAPGEDGDGEEFVGEGEGEGEANDTLEVFVDNPRVGDRIFSGDELVLGARVEGTVADDVEDAELSWGFVVEGSAVVNPLGTGRVLLVDTSAQPLLLGEVEIVLSAAHGGLTDEARATIFVDPLIVQPTFNARVDLGVGGSAIALPQLTVGDDGVVTLAMSATQPVALSATVLDGRGVDVSGGLEWASDTGFLFTGPDAAFSILPVGTHRFNVRFRDGQNLVDAAEVDVVVAALDFSVVINAPLELAANNPPGADDPPYFRDLGVPLVATVRHPFQIVFPVTAATWRDADGNVVATGPLLRQQDGSFVFRGRARNLPSGAHLLTFELADVQGNLVEADTLITVQDVVFTTAFTAPADNADLEEGVDVVVGVSVSHSLLGNGLARSDLRVTYTSSLLGVLRDGAGASSFSVDATPALRGLNTGRHVLTARVSDGRGLATAVRTVTIRRPGVTVTLLEPRDDSTLSPGLPVRFTANAVEDDVDDNATFAWFIDGVELDASFDDYGTDPASPNRLTLNLGNFTPATGIFNDARLAPGDHVVSFCATLVGVTSCAESRIEIPPVGFELCPNANLRTIGAGVTETWTGLRRMNCDILIAGGTVIIEPGARIVVDDLASGARVLRLGQQGGQLLIGSSSSNQGVVLESNVALIDAWEGITLETFSTSPALVRIENTTVRHAGRAIQANAGTFDGEGTRFELRDVTFESVIQAIEGFCPDVVDGVTVDNFNAAVVDAPAISEDSSTLKCQAPHTYRRLDLKNVDTGMQLFRGARVTIEDSSFANIPDHAVHPLLARNGFPDELVTIRRSTFDNIGRGSDGNAQSAVVTSGCSRMHIEDSTFTNNLIGAQEDNDECRFHDDPRPRLLITRSTFADNDTAVGAFNGMGQRPVVLRLNHFDNNTFDIRTEGNAALGVIYATDVDAAGNFFSRSAPVLAGLPAGRAINLPGIADFFDNPANDRVARTSPGVAASLAGVDGAGATALIAPDQHRRYVASDCIKPEVFTIDDADVSFVSSDPQPGECRAFFTGESGDPAGVDLTGVDVDGNGCLVGDVAAGEHTLAVHCAHDAGVDVHSARFLVDVVRAGQIDSPGTITWSGTVVLDGGGTIPAGTTLVIAPGTEVLMATSDRLFLQKFPNHADNPDGSDTNCSGALQCYTDRGTNATFGERTLVDLYIEGSLRAEGTAADPIVFRSVDDVNAAGRWGGIRVSLGALAVLDHVDIRSADVAIQTEYAPIDPFSDADVRITNTSISSSRVGLRGSAPAVFSGNRMERVESPMSEVFVSTGLTLADSDFIDVGNASISGNASPPLFIFGSYSSGGSEDASLVFDDVTVDRLGGTRGQSVIETDQAARISTVVIRDSAFSDFFGLVNLSGDRVGLALNVILERSTATNFETLIQQRSDDIEKVDIDQCRFTNGTRVFTRNDGVNEIEVTRTSFRGVQRPVDVVDLDGGSTFSITINDSEFDGCVTCVELRTAFNVIQDNTPDLRRNNFTNSTAALVIRPDNLDADTRMSVDLSGSFFNTASQATVETLITDPQADLGADFDGRTRIAPFSPTALTLDLLTP